MSRVTLCPTGAGRGGVSPGSRRRGSGQELPRRLDMLLRPASGRVSLLRLPGMVVLAGTGSAAPLAAAPGLTPGLMWHVDSNRENSVVVRGAVALRAQERRLLVPAVRLMPGDQGSV